jgi:hypothetical protein
MASPEEDGFRQEHDGAPAVAPKDDMPLDLFLQCLRSMADAAQLSI